MLALYVVKLKKSIFKFQICATDDTIFKYLWDADARYLPYIWRKEDRKRDKNANQPSLHNHNHQTIETHLVALKAWESFDWKRLN